MAQITIRNMSNRPLIINCGKGRVVHLIPGGEADISKVERGTQEIHQLLDQRDLLIVERAAPKHASQPARPPDRKGEASGHKRK